MRRSGAPVQMGSRRGARDLFGAAWGTVTEIIWSALAGVFKTSPSVSTSSPAGACATPLLTEAIVRRAGALVALGAASVLVPLLFPAVEALKYGVLAAYAIVLLGCASVFLSPAHHAIAYLVRRAAEATGDIFGASWRAAAEPWSAAAICRTGALVALAATSALLLLLLPDHAVVASKNINGVVLALYAVFLLGCAAVLLSPAHRTVTDLARRLTEAAGEIFGAPWRAAAKPWSETAGAVRRTGALVGVFKASPCSSASSPSGARATPLLTEATVRRAGALLALGAASVLVPLLFSQPDDLKHGVLAAYAIFLLGLLLSPAHRAVAELVLRAAEAAGEIFVAPWRAAAEPCYETAATVRRTGALVALAAASKLLLLLMPVPAVVASKNINGVVLALYFVFLLGCSEVLLSPAHPAIANLARRAAEAARKNLHATGRTNAVLRWAGFTCICIVFSTTCAVGSVRAEAAAAAVTVVSSPEQFGILVLFLLFLVGVWAVSLSMVTGRGPPTLPVRLPLPLQRPAEDEHGACGPRSDSVNTREQRQHEEQTTCHL